jgi:hypothetical protein
VLTDNNNITRRVYIEYTVVKRLGKLGDSPVLLGMPTLSREGIILDLGN